MIKKFLAFTLGEILIALTVIGVVAVLVMPQLVLGQKEAKAKAQFNTAYAILAKSIAEMDADEVSTDPKNYVKAGAFYPVLKQYQKVTIDCGVYAATNDSVCISTTNRDNSSDYTIRKNNNTKMNAHMLDDGAFVINNGMLFVIENPANNPNGLLVSIDINVQTNGVGIYSHLKSLKAMFYLLALLEQLQLGVQILQHTVMQIATVI